MKLSTNALIVFVFGVCISAALESALAGPKARPVRVASAQSGGAETPPNSQLARGTGACCYGAACSVELDTTCAFGGGYYLGDGTDCSASPCDAGACCILDITTVICDDAAGTMDESTCTVEFEGTYIGGALCDSTADPCPACQFYDSDHCQADADSFIFTSDRNSGLRRADDFEAVGTLINRVCWRFGYYPAPGQPECADNPPDGAFEIRFYENSSGVPGLELANSPGSVIPDRRKRKAGTRIWDYSAPISPSITVSTGSCYWIEITADGTANCVTGWAGSDDGNSFSMWDGDGEYTIEDIQPDDMAFCIDTEIIPGSEPGIDGGCGRVDVACCLPGGDCDDLGVYGECFDAYGVHFFGEACGSITCPDPGNDDCAEAAVICEDLDIDGDVGACDNADGIEGPACSVSVPDCYDLSSCNAWNYDAYRCTVDTDNRLTNTDGPDTIGTDCQPSGNNAFQADVWYHVVAPCKGDMVVNMCNAESSYDALMGIFGDHTETCICPSDNDANLACSDDFCGGPAVASAAEVAVERDACYTIRVGGWSYDGTALDAAQGESELDIGFFCDFTHLYVDADVIGGANDGTSWPNAFASLQDALSEASLLGSITDIWVAEGTYHPDEGVGIGSGDRNASFQLLDGVAIYGGFVGNETQFGQRNVTDNVTILSGDLDDNDADPTSDCCTAHGTPGCDDVACETAVCAADAFCCIEPWDATCADLATTTYCVALCAPGDNSENSYHVVNGSGTDTTAALDGFTISGGNADLLGFVGGGVYNDSGSPTLSNCIFANNKADVEGGGIWNNGGSPIITDCTFTSNSATVGGAAVNTGAGCAPTYSGCIFSSNTATSHSGAMHNAPGSTPEVIDCRFSRNSAPGTGAVWSDSSDAVFVDCTFVDNVSTGAGPGALDVTTGEVEVVNCTFLGNEAESYGGALGARIGATVNVTNCVFSGNTAVNESGGAIVASDLGTNLTVTNSTFSLNDAGNLGGGIRVDTDAGAAVKNSIFWRNSDIGGMDESAQIDSSGGSAAVDYSIVQDGWTGGGGTGNSSGDPRFVDADGIDDIAGTEDDNVRLSPGSPGLDAGFNDALPADTEDIDDDGNVGELTPIDLAGYPRFKDDPFTDPDPGDAGTSGLPVVDMGAYEYTPPLLVDIDAVDGNQDGSSWENAFLDPAEALAVARDSAGAVTEIWVAAGEYPPTGGDRTASVELVDGVGVYGGFAGTEIFREDRNVKDNQTILSGDRNGDDASVACGNDSPDCDSFGGRCVEDFCIIADNNGDNVYHVVTASGVGPTTVLDGFTVTAGNANGSFEDSTDRGGGMHSNAGSPTVTHCTFRGNSATFGGGMHNKNDSSPTLIGCTFSGNSGTDAGGGMINVGSHPTLTNCTFSWNSATNFGGGMYSVNSSTPTLIDCTFSRNLATGDAAGGGMSSRFSSHPTLTNCTFTGNLADRGGGMHNSHTSSPTLTNCTLIGNSATDWGGGLFNWNSSPALTNCTFTGNAATNDGGGMYSNNGSSPLLGNCIFWGNRDSGGTDETAQIYDDGTGTLTIDYTLVEGLTGGLGGAGNIDGDPMFVNDPYDGGDGWGDENDDYGDVRLDIASPCIDAADNTAVPADTVDLDDDTDVAERIPLDLDYGPRFIEDLLIADTGIADPPDYLEVVDMGAYEFMRDCNENGIPDEQDLEDCAGDPWCDDCNSNDIPDECDIYYWVPDTDDCNINDIPDWCDDPADSEPDTCVYGECLTECNWTDEIWGLGPGNYPDNQDSIDNLNITLDDVDVTMDEEIEINTLRMLRSAQLYVTGIERTSVGLIVVSDGGIVIDGILPLGSTSTTTLWVGADDTVTSTNIIVTQGGEILVEGDAFIDVSNQFTVGPAGSYAASPAASGVGAFLEAETVEIQGGSCEDMMDGGQITLTDKMMLTTTGDLILSGGDEPDCFTARGGITPPPKLIVGCNDKRAGSPTVDVGGDMVLTSVTASVAFCADRGPGGISMSLAGDFVNQSKSPHLFAGTGAKILLSGTGSQKFETAGVNFGPTDDGFARGVCSDSGDVCGGADDPACPSPNPWPDVCGTNFRLGTLEISADSVVTFVDESDNDGYGQDTLEALYLDNLIFGVGAQVTIDNCIVYYRTLQDNDVVPTVLRSGTLRRIDALTVPPGIPTDWQHQAHKHRYISFDPSTNLDSEVAYKVELVEMTRCSGDLRRTCSSDSDCPNVCDNDPDVTCTGDPACSGGTCVVTTPCVHHPDEGLSWWVQAPQQEALGCRLPGGCTDEDWFARLDVTPHFQTWNDFGAADSSLLHISDCQITPVATYAVSACGPPTGEVCSDPLMIGTILRPPPGNYGDVVGPVDPVTTEFDPPNQILSVGDISGYLLTNLNYGLPGDPKPQAHWTWVDMEGQGAPFYRPQGILNVGDLNQILFGLMGRPYSWAGNNVDPGGCP